MENRIQAFNLALQWIDNNTIEGKGIAVSSKNPIIYPEVTGYYIPTLLTWGEREKACSYAKYLCARQQDDGSWYDPNDSAPYVFDSAQILKGLIAIRQLLPEVDGHIIKGVDWILSNMHEDGRLTTPDEEAWGSNEDFCSELVHIYCLSPIKEAGEIFGRKDYIDAVDKIIAYYKREKIDQITNFSLLSHFYAYVMEGLFDIGEVDLCRESMRRLEKYRNKKRGIPGLYDVPWVCSTGLFQLAIVWYKLGDLERGNSLFYYALSLQNKSGGWYGSYPAPGLRGRFCRGRRKPYYFPDTEISWAVKYFLDALAHKEKLEFDKMSSIFTEDIDENDGRYVLIKNIIKNFKHEKMESLKVCDIGCGKGRYLKRLCTDLPGNDYYSSDLSETVMQDITCVKEKRIGSLTNIDYSDNMFDIVYVCEAYEHAISLRAAFRELYRVTKTGGKFIIIDKPIEKLGQLEIYEWEQWISDENMKRFTEECGGTIEIIKSVPHENTDDGLFRAWIVTKG